MTTDGFRENFLGIRPTNNEEEDEEVFEPVDVAEDFPAVGVEEEEEEELEDYDWTQMLMNQTDDGAGNNNNSNLIMDKLR